MEIITKETVSEQAKPILPSGRALLSIDEYAGRQGLSADTVEKCIRLGIIQTRTFKNQTFVVDKPLNSYPELSKITEELTPKPEQNSGCDSANKIIKDKTEQFDTSVNNPTSKAGSISRLIKKMLRKSSKASRELEDEIERNINIVEDSEQQIKIAAEQGPSPPQKNRDLETNLYAAVPITSSEALEIINEPSQQTGKDNFKASTAESRRERAYDEEIKVIDEPTEEEIRQVESLFEPIRIPEIAMDEICEDFPGLTGSDLCIESSRSNNGTARNKRRPCLFAKLFRHSSKAAQKTATENHELPLEADRPLKPQLTPANNNVEFGMLTVRARAKRAWQMSAILFGCLCFVSVCCLVWLYMDRRMNMQAQSERLEQAYASVQELYDTSTQADAKGAALQNQLNDANAELERLKNQLKIANEKLKNAEEQLSKTSENLQAMQDKNTKSVEQLHKQIQKLTTQINSL